MVEAYPLYWPENRARTDRSRRENARFEMRFARARDEVSRQIELLCGRYSAPSIVISTNLPLRRDGLPLASQRPPDDTGVAVYFMYKKKQTCFACDRWLKIEDNMQAIAKTIDALRGVARWGTGDMLEAAFTGFMALPPPDSGTFSNTYDAAKWIVEVSNEVYDPALQKFAITALQHKPTPEEALRVLRIAKRNCHPDKDGGSQAKFIKLQKAQEILGL